MNKRTKVVNIYPSMPITGVNPPIRTTVKRVTKSIEEIRACLMARATIEEVLADGSTVRLNIGNYDKLNTAHGNACQCGCCAEKTETKTEDDTKAVWQRAYEKALEGKNLAAMTRKQRRSADAAARALADAVVAGNVTESEETDEEVAVEESEVAESVEVEVVEDEVVEEVEEEVVETADVEELASNDAE